MKASRHTPHLARDVIIVAASLLLAYTISRSEYFAELVASVGFLPLEAFVAGFFFTSLLTIAPAGVAFAEMMQFASIADVAFWGALGAVVGDLVIFLYVRDAITDELMSLLRGPWGRKITALFKSPFLSWAVPVAGALFIALPIPDEIGLAMLGLSKTDIRFLIPVSFVMNFIGIYLIGLVVAAG